MKLRSIADLYVTHLVIAAVTFRVRAQIDHGYGVAVKADLNGVNALFHIGRKVYGEFGSGLSREPVDGLERGANLIGTLRVFEAYPDGNFLVQRRDAVIFYYELHGNAFSDFDLFGQRKADGGKVVAHSGKPEIHLILQFDRKGDGFGVEGADVPVQCFFNDPLWHIAQQILLEINHTSHCIAKIVYFLRRWIK